MKNKFNLKLNSKLFWKNLSKNDLFNLIRSAPMVAGPWQLREACDCGCEGSIPLNHWNRFVYYGNDTILCASAKPFEDDKLKFKSTTWRGEFIESFGPFETINEAKESADKELQKAGWILINNIANI